MNHEEAHLSSSSTPKRLTNESTTRGKNRALRVHGQGPVQNMMEVIVPEYLCCIAFDGHFNRHMIMDYIDSETEEPDDLPYLETEYGMPPPLAAECKSFKWKIEVIEKVKLKFREHIIKRSHYGTVICVGKEDSVIVNLFAIPSLENSIGESGGLLGSWLGQLRNDANLQPINYSDWRMVNPHIKNKVWEVIQSKLWFNDPPMRKVFVMNALGSRCKDVKLRLWKEYKRNSLSETLLNRPENVPENQWGHFVHMRFTEKWKKMQERNIESQKKNIMPHVLGRKRFSKKRNDMEELTTLLGQKSHVTNNAIASLDDEYAQVFGPERPGRVQCVGRGPTPSKLVNHSPVTRQEIEN
ncbi:hypothetical protein YC2023_018172 [Brassica napus]